MNDSSGVSRGASGLLRVLVDMDGVICDFEAHMLSEFRRLFPKEPYVRPHERRSFYIIDDYERLRPGLGVRLQANSQFLSTHKSVWVTDVAQNNC